MPLSPRAADLVGQPRRSRRRRGAPCAGQEPLGLAEYRREVIRLGAYMGWAEADVARFAEPLTGRSWQDCRTTELGQVVGTYAEIATPIRARLSNVEP